MTEQEKKDAGEAKHAPALLKKAPQGSEFVFNRLNKKFEKLFDGFPYVFEPLEERLMPKAIAEFMYRGSVIKYEPVTGREIRALVTPDDPDYGQPYEEDLGIELLDRSVNDNYTQRGTNGVPTKAKTVEVKGGGYDQGRKVTTGSRL